MINKEPDSRLTWSTLLGCVTSGSMWGTAGGTQLRMESQYKDVLTSWPLLREPGSSGRPPRKFYGTHFRTLYWRMVKGTFIYGLPLVKDLSQVFKLLHFFLGFSLHQNFNQQASGWEERCKRGWGSDTVRLKPAGACLELPAMAKRHVWSPEDRKWKMGDVI